MHGLLYPEPRFFFQKTYGSHLAFLETQGARSPLLMALCLRGTRARK